MKEVSGPVYGYRAWRLRGSGLYSFSGWRAWPDDRPKEALCWKNFLSLGVAHHAPGFNCHCGLYAWANPPKHPCSPQGMVPVWGVVELSGRAIRHPEGYRAQFARPVAVVYTPGIELTVMRYRLSILEDLSAWEGKPV